MASYTATRIKHATLTANTVDVVTLGAGYPYIEVINRDASADLYFTIDRGDASGSDSVTPTVAGDECLYVGAGGVRIAIDDTPVSLGYVTPAHGAPVPASVVRLISAGATAYTVTGHRALPV